MHINVEDTQLRVTREKGDPKYYNGGWGSAESCLLYHIKKALIVMGYDVVKKNPQKDGHMVSNDHYLRERTGFFAIIDGQYAIRNMADEFNKEGVIVLDIHGDMPTTGSILC